MLNLALAAPRSFAAAVFGCFFGGAVAGEWRRSRPANLLLRRTTHLCSVCRLSPWDAPVPLSRAWCLWELYCTTKGGSRFSVCLGPAELAEFEREAMQSGTAVLDAFGDIDVAKAEASDPADLAMILVGVSSGSLRHARTSWHGRAPPRADVSCPADCLHCHVHSHVPFSGVIWSVTFYCGFSSPPPFRPSANTSLTQHLPHPTPPTYLI